METESIKLDADGIPILENPLDIDRLPDTTPVAAIDMTDRDKIDQAMLEETVRNAMDDLTEDLQKMVSWKIESFLKEELSKLIHDAAEKSAPKLAEDMRTQLQLALPDLLAGVCEAMQNKID